MVRLDEDQYESNESKIRRIAKEEVKVGLKSFKSNILIDTDNIRNMIKNEISDHHFRAFLVSHLFGSDERPMNRQQITDLCNSTVGHFSAVTLPSLVYKEVNSILLTNNGITSILNNCKESVEKLIKSHNSKVNDDLKKQKDELERIRREQIEQTRQDMRRIGQDTVKSLINSDDGKSIIKGIEDNVRSSKMFTYGGVSLLALFSSIVGGLIVDHFKSKSR